MVADTLACSWSSVERTVRTMSLFDDFLASGDTSSINKCDSSSGEMEQPTVFEAIQIDSDSTDEVVRPSNQKRQNVSVSSPGVPATCGVRLLRLGYLVSIIYFFRLRMYQPGTHCQMPEAGVIRWSLAQENYQSVILSQER